VDAPTPAATRRPREWTGRCSGCGADLPLDPEHRVVRCAHCGAANLVAGRLVRPAARFRAELSAADVEAAVGRFARSRDLDALPSIIAREEAWIPYWVPAQASAGASARVAIEIDEPQLAERALPSGELEPLDPQAVEVDPAWRWPTVPALEGEVLRCVPFFRVRLTAGGRELTAWVDRADGRVHTSEPLNPQRLRFTGLLGVLLGGYALVALGLGLFSPNPFVALGGLAAASVAFGWPASRLAARRGSEPSAGTGGGAG